MKIAKSTRWFVLLLAPVLCGGCIAEAAGPTQTPRAAIATAAGGETGADPTATPTVALVTMTAGQDLSCAKGPDSILYEWVADVFEGETVTLLARSTAGWPDYYYARTDDGTECWASGGSSVIHGDPSTLPEREAPPLPEVTLSVENQLHVAVDELYIRARNTSDWGANRLTGNLDPGSAFALALTAGYYDVRIIDTHDSEVYLQEDIPIGSEAGSRLLSVDTTVHFYIENRYPENLCRIRAFPTDGSPVIDFVKPEDDPAPYGERIYKDIPCGEYDFEFSRCGDLQIVGHMSLYIGPSKPGVVFH